MKRAARALQVFEALFGLERENNGIPMDDETFKRELMKRCIYGGKRASRSSLLYWCLTICIGATGLRRNCCASSCH